MIERAAAVRGTPSSLEDAVSAAARLLRAAKQPLIAVGATCAAGARACAALAAATGGVLDHLQSAEALAGLDVMRQGRTLLTSPPEARARADLVLLVGEGVLATWPDAYARLALEDPPSLVPGASRRVLRLCPGKDLGPGPDTETVGCDRAELAELLGLLRALVAGRRLPEQDPRLASLRPLATALREARYGVAIWAAASLDPLATEMLTGLIDDLNESTRFAGLPLAPGGNVAGVAQALAAATGFPFRLGFGRGAAEHDPWRFDAVRLIERGEVDVVLLVAPPALPDSRVPMPLVALHAPGTAFASPPTISITVGRPGIDHDAILFDPRVNALVAFPAAEDGDLPSAAAVLASMLTAIRSEAAAC